MNVRAKFTVSAKFPCQYGGTMLHMAAVYSSDPKSENKSFADATPSANLQMHIAEGKRAADAFAVGQEFFVDFTPVPKAEVAAA